MCKIFCITKLRECFQYEKPWIRPQPKDETACQDTNVHAHKGFRHISVSYAVFIFHIRFVLPF